jgi:hypothetical protein
MEMYIDNHYHKLGIGRCAAHAPPPAPSSFWVIFHVGRWQHLLSVSLFYYFLLVYVSLWLIMIH